MKIGKHPVNHRGFGGTPRATVGSACGALLSGRKEYDNFQQVMSLISFPPVEDNLVSAELSPVKGVNSVLTKIVKIFMPIVFILVINDAYASLLDFNYIKKAEDAYAKQDYKNAAINYGKIDNDEARFNLADSLYRDKKYQQAIDVYKSIQDKNLEFKKLHNLGNSYANLGKISEAIKSYEAALTIEQDEDTKYNLDLLKKQQQKNQDKDNQQNNPEGKSSQNNDKQDNKEKSDEQNGEGKEEQDKKQQQQSKNSEDAKKEKHDKKAAEKEKLEQEKHKSQEKIEPENNQQAEISNMEERKWQNMLNNKGIQTLLLPITREKRNETKPW